jgi:hypothetical protein
MAAYTNDLRLKEIATGDESGTWGTSTNTNLELIAEAFSFGTEAITTNADTHATTIADGSTDEGRSIYLKYTGTLDSACTITLGPNTVSKLWFIENGTSGSQNIIISQGSGSNVTIPAGHVKAVYSDGAGSGAAIVDAFTDLNLAGTTTIDVLSASGNATIGGTLGVTGAVTADAGVSIDNITIDGTEIDLSSGNLTVDVAGNITLNADDDGKVFVADDSVTYGLFENSSSDFVMESRVQDKDILFKGNDGGSGITALTLDMSDAGTAVFNNKVGIGTSSPANNLHIFTDAGDEGITIKSTGNTSNAIIFDANRSGAGSSIGEIQSKWNGTTVAMIASATGSDTTNKDDGLLIFYTSSADNIAEKMRVNASGTVGIGSTVDRSLGTNITTVVINGSSGGGLWLSPGDSSAMTSQIYAQANGSVGDLIINNGTGVGSGGIIFQTNSSEKVRIASNGNVGIGTNDTGNAKLVFNGNISEGADTAMIDFDGFGTRGDASSQSINFRMGRTGFATDQPAQIKSFFQGGGATAGQTAIGFKFVTISENTQQDQFFIDAAYSRFKFNTSESPQSNNPQTNNCFVIGPSSSGAVTQALTNACVLMNRGGELFAVDSSHNNTQLTPHNWTLIEEGPSEELAWTYWSQKPNPDNPDQLQGINVDMAKVVRKVEDLVGEKLIYTENSNMDSHTHKTIISDIQATLADLKTRVEALEG